MQSAQCLASRLRQSDSTLETHKNPPILVSELIHGSFAARVLFLVWVASSTMEVLYSAFGVYTITPAHVVIGVN